MAPRNVVVFHSNEDVRRFLAGALHSEHGRFRVVGDASEMSEALVLARFHQPALLLVGYREGADMSEFVYQLRAAAPNARVVGYVESDQDPARHVPGYDAFVTQKRHPQRLLEALDRAFAAK